MGEGSDTINTGKEKRRLTCHYHDLGNQTGFCRGCIMRILRYQLIAVLITRREIMKKNLFRILIAGLFLCIITWAFPVQETSAAIMKLNKTKLTVEKGAHKKIKIKNGPSNASVTFKSSNPKVAKVTKYGNVYGKKAGRATISVTVSDGSNTKVFKCKVTVINPADSGKEEKMTPEYSINSFSYSYNNSFGDGSYSVEIEKNEGKYTFLYSEKMSKYSFEPVQMDEEAMLALEKACQKNRINEWNGFHESDPEVLDGDGFSLFVGYEEGNISVSGSNCSPAGYWDFLEEFKQICDPYIKIAMKAAVNDYISCEHSKKLDSFMISFSNSDYPKDHDIFIYSYIGRNGTHLEYRISLSDNSVYSAGDYYFNKDVDPKVVDFSKMSSIITKYNLDGLDNANEHTDGGEWYQIDYGYDDDFRIGFCGTKPFENYDNVRKEIFDFIFSIVDATR